MIAMMVVAVVFFSVIMVIFVEAFKLEERAGGRVEKVAGADGGEDLLEEQQALTLRREAEDAVAVAETAQHDGVAAVKDAGGVAATAETTCFLLV